MRPKVERKSPRATPDPNGVIHPGQYVREECLSAAKISVTAAAKAIGISRPGVSDFLNGKVSATPEMASRIERAFGVPAQTLLDMQAAFDVANAKDKGLATSAKTYVPRFLGLTANQIEQWAEHNIKARTRFSVFLRTLVHSTGLGLIKVDFPGNDDAERPGWDGEVEATEGTSWVPFGHSGWEFGTDKKVQPKAEKDFAKSVKAHDEKTRAAMTFVFVTPRRWPGKAKWAAAAKAKALWKDVRVYDSSDLEQWLEQSLAGQSWFANEIHVSADNVRSLDKCWSDWADVANPPLSGALFASAIDAAKRTIHSRLTRDPDGPTIIAADSTEEALAFLSQLLSERAGPELAVFRDRVLVFDKPGVLPRLAQGKQTFIPVVVDREIEREAAPFVKTMQCIVIYPRNVANADPHVVLEPVSYETFRLGLQDMQKDRDQISRLADASGRSLTVLRRQLSNSPAVRTPEWASDTSKAASLVPFLFVGAWNSKNETDQTALSLLAGRPYEELEKTCQSLVAINDTPVWSIGTFRGVISKIDLLYAIAGTVTAADLRRYFSLARMVLGEDDPALDLAEDERWAAAIHGKAREFSAAFREGISETLVLLGVHGNHLFKKHLGVDAEMEVVLVLRDLLPAPLTLRVLEANDRDLPTYAEAAPDEFLRIIEQDLKSEHPVVLGLMRPADTGILGRSPSRTGLLWALEGLSWSPVTLPRAANILARLAQVEINDNWVNKPTHSLESIFRAWMPQTAASHEVRVDVMKRLAEKFPDVAWKICVAQFGGRHQVGDYSHKPKWRPDGYGFGEPFPTWGPVHAFMREMVEMALSWKSYDANMLGDLLARMHDLDTVYQTRVWALVTAWANDKARDDDKAVLREKIRVNLLTRRAAKRTKLDKIAAQTEAAKVAFAALEPTDLINKHSWLFRDGWVEESADEIHGEEEIDFDKREKRIEALRTAALKEIYAERGAEGIFELTDRGKAGWQIGWLMARFVLQADEIAPFFIRALEPVLEKEEDVFARKNLIAGGLRSTPSDEERVARLSEISKSLSEQDRVPLFLLATFRSSTWKLVDQLSSEAQEKYWTEVAAEWIHDSDAENIEAVERLLKAGRPRAAFACAHFHPEKLGPSLLVRLLSAMATGGLDEPGHYQLEQYSVEQAFKHLNESSEVSVEEKARLEFAYIDVLARPWSSDEGYGIPNLELYIESHPEVYVQAVTWTYKRDDGGIDPTEFRIDPDNIKAIAHRGYKLLEGLERIPGHDDLGELKKDRLMKWVKTVRDACSDLARADVADLNLGKLFSSAPIGKDGVWPCEVVRDALEELQADKIMDGAHTGLYNARGVVWRGEGGAQERELADKYRKWAEALQTSHPYVSSKLLMGMVRTYEYEASREDTEAGIRRRLR